MLLVEEEKTTSLLHGLLWISVTVGLMSYSAAYSHGGSPSSCSDMRPKHIRAQPQNTRKNYVTVHTNRSFYLPGDKVPVTIRSTRDFMGFFLQARRVVNDQVAGSFVVIPSGSKLLRCFEDGDTVTHSDKSLKRNLSFVWKSPDQPVGDIKFFVSVVQSYFVYWARIESSVVSGLVEITTSENLRSTLEVSQTSPTSMLDVRKHPSTSSQTDFSSLMSSTRTKPPETSAHIALGRDKTVSYVPSVITETPQSVTVPSITDLTLTTRDSSTQLHLTTTLQPSTFNRTVTEIIQTRNHQHPHEAVIEICSSCEEEIKAVSSDPPLSSPGSTLSPSSLPPDLLTWLPTPTLPTQDILQDPITLNLHGHPLSPSTTRRQDNKPTNEIAANFLQQPESKVSDKNAEVYLESTSPLVTKTVQENGNYGKGGDKGRGMPLAMTQMSILLGCSVVLGMALAASIRCIHAQYCHKRTEVSFSEPDDNVITLRENGEMMQFKKIRENSFVLVQAEYNWITPALSAKTQ